MESKQEGQNQDLIRHKCIKQGEKCRSYSITRDRKGAWPDQQKPFRVQRAPHVRLMHWLGLKATTMQSDNFQTVFARSTAAKKGFMS